MLLIRCNVDLGTTSEFKQLLNEKIASYLKLISYNKAIRFRSLISLVVDLVIVSISYFFLYVRSSKNFIKSAFD
jgi:hypothetical protein